MDMSEQVDDTETSFVDSTERCVNKSAVGIEDNQSFTAVKRGKYRVLTVALWTLPQAEWVS
jgi:hypothetical protein